MVAEHVISVNGEEVHSFQHEVQPGDMLSVRLAKGSYEEKVIPLTTFKPVVVAFHKPLWVIVSKDDDQGKTIYSYLPESRKKDFYYIGRLDKDSHGLQLLTNVPSLVDEFESPHSKIHKTYHVVIDKPWKKDHEKKCKYGIWVNLKWEAAPLTGKENPDALYAKGYEQLKAVSCRLVHLHDLKTLHIVLTEGKKRQIRRMLKALWYNVRDLKRIKVWPYQLGGIKPGKYQIQPLLVPR